MTTSKIYYQGWRTFSIFCSDDSHLSQVFFVSFHQSRKPKIRKYKAFICPPVLVGLGRKSNAEKNANVSIFFVPQYSISIYIMLCLKCYSPVQSPYYLFANTFVPGRGGGGFHVTEGRKDGRNPFPFHFRHVIFSGFGGGGRREQFAHFVFYVTKSGPFRDF